MIAAPGYGKECDMWAVGVILYVVLSGRPPFYSSNQKKLFKIIMSGKFYFEPANEWEHISDAAKDLIRNLLVVDPKKRFTAAQVLEHPWTQPPPPTPNIDRAISALKNPEYVKRVKILLDRDRMRRAVKFLVSMNRLISVFHIKDAMRRLSNWRDVRPKMKPPNIIPLIPGVNEWKEVKLKFRPLSNLKITQQLKPGTAVLIGGEKSQSVVLKRECKVLRRKGYWWVADKSLNEAEDESKWILVHVHEMIAATRDDGGEVKVTTARRHRASSVMFEPLDANIKIKPIGQERGSTDNSSDRLKALSTDTQSSARLDGAGMLDALFIGCLRIIGTRYQLIQMIQNKEKRAVSFYSHVAWFRTGSCGNDEGMNTPETIQEAAKDITSIYLQKGR